MPRQAAVLGPATVRAVDDLVATKGISKSAAFRELSDASGRTPAAISTLYYLNTAKRRDTPRKVDPIQSSIQSIRSGLDQLEKALAGHRSEQREMRARLDAAKRAVGS